MKITKISEKQVRKLLKISRKLFPRYYIKWFDDSNEMVFSYSGDFESCEDAIGIHWYQLCMETLPLKLCKSIDNKKNVEGSSLSSIMFAINQEAHPVEGLWKEWKHFKNHLKNEKCK